MKNRFKALGKRLHSSYLEVLFKFFPKMANIRTRNAIKAALNEFIASFQKDEYKQYSFWDEFSNGSSTDITMEFHFGSYQFSVRGEIFTSMRGGILKTYQIVPNPMSYPNKMEKHLPDMDIIIFPIGNMRFVKSMIRKIDNIGVDMEHDFSEINDFSISYGPALRDIVAEYERQEYGPILERMGERIN